MWFYLALYFALWTSIYTVLVKKVTKTVDPLSFVFIINVFYIPLVFAVIMVSGGIPHASSQGYFSMVIAGFLDTIAFVAATIAIKRAPISLLAPLAAFNPVFTTLFAIVGLSEIPTPTKFIGIFIIVIGSYLLNMEERKKGWFMPLQELFGNRGVQLFLLANLIWGITPIFQKRAILDISPQAPLFVSLIGFSAMTLFLLPFVYKKLPAIPSLIQKTNTLGWFLLIAIGGVVAYAAAFTAFSLTHVGYATAIFKLSVLFTILWGAVVFKEKHIRERLFAAMVMLLGTMLLVI